ncbi:hypothetical protein AVL48_10510 [Amycolatopsis regifaucium]|uniref:Uncharacterized protein n=1 Tax=Amycolatopsis regifaucium TaxID=546365 RepID=A0A154MCR2_9PSEU|nr:hypothetical protein AVL48_10510 [Amycolatopsis regifaucium]
MVGDLPEGRWAAYRASGPAASAAINGAVSRAAYLENAAGFDAEFFGVTPREAVYMDPQQRLMLEVVWEALEHAGIAPSTLAGSDAGVIIGVGGGEYGQMLLATPEQIEPWSSIGGSYCAVANRVSYFLDLHGPSFAVDSACSSALASLHLGAQALRAGECEVVIAGGVNLIAAPAQTLSLGASGALAADGRSKPFSAAADGYGRGEGAAVVVLKRMSDARRDGNEVLAVVRASGIRQDGRTNGIMAPNGEAQIEMLRGIYDRAGISPSAVDYLEAHGTGTPLGDPVEASAAATVFGDGRSGGKPLLIGSAKGNVGHLEAGAGVVGVIKAVLAMRNEAIPPTVGVGEGVNPAVLTSRAVRVVAEATPWKRRPDRPRLAGISSFGYGGTIAHTVLEEGDPVSAGPSDDRDGRPRTLVLSAASPAALRESADRLATALEVERPDLDAVAGTLAVRRSHLPWRMAVVAENRTQAADRLRAWSVEADAGLVRLRTGGVQTAPVFVFSGHGSQWVGMGRELLARSAEFAGVCEEFDPIFREERGFSLISALESDDLTRTDRIQAILVAMQLGLTQVWRAQGVEPAAVVGHSMGEIAAAAVAGVWSREDAVRFACRRASLLESVAGRGAMVVLDIPFGELEARLVGEAGLDAAVEPAPGWSVVCGDAHEVAAFAAERERKGNIVRRVASDVAFHGVHMDPLLGDLGEAAADLKIGPALLPLYSSSLTDPRSTAPRDPAYWQGNMRNPVRFAGAITALLEDGYRHFLEVSSHPIVRQNIDQTAEKVGVDGVTTAHSLRRAKPELAEIAGQLGVLHCAGALVDWRKAWPESPSADLPLTAWQHQRFWLPDAVNDQGGEHDAASHLLLGARTAVATTPPATVWQTRLAPGNRPYDEPHTVHGADIVPAAVLLGTLIAAISPENGEPRRLRDVALRTPLPAEQDRAVQVVVQDGVAVLSSRAPGAHADSGWITHTSARDGGPVTWRPDAVAGDESARGVDEPVGNDHVLDLLRPLGVSGLAFEWQVDHLAHDTRSVAATVSLAGRAPSWVVIADAAMTLASLPLADKGVYRMPASVESVELYGPSPAEAHIEARLREGSADTIDVRLRGLDGTSVARFTGLRFGVVDAESAQVADPPVFLHGMSWQPVETVPSTAEPVSVTLVTPEPTPDADRLVRHLTRNGVECALADGTATARNGEGGQRHDILFLAPAKTAGGEIDTGYESVVRNLISLVHSTQAAIRSAGSTRLWVLTNGARECVDEAALAQRPLWGATRIIAAEHPELRCGVIDLDDDQTETLDRLAEVLRRPPNEDWLSIGAGVLRAARVVPRPDRAQTPRTRLNPDATYLVTGGLGALGLEAARHLHARGARNLVLTSRTGLPDRSSWSEQRADTVRRAIEVIEELESAGATVRPLALDVTDFEPARAALTPEALGLPEIRGVVHAAGTVRGCLVDAFDEGLARDTLHAKVKGALVLHRLFPPGSLDEMVLFSSTAPLVTLPGVTAYAAANTFLDGLAAHRRGRGTDTVAIAWTAWRDTGMGRLNADSLQSMQAQGFGGITPTEALQVWDCLHTVDDGYALVVRPVGPPQGGRRALFEHVVDPVDPMRDGRTSTPQASLRDLPEEEIHDAAMTEVCRLVAEVTGVPVERVEPDRPFSDIGLDSVMSISIRGRLQQSTGVELPASVMWTHPTPDTLARYLAKGAASGQWHDGGGRE